MDPEVRPQDVRLEDAWKFISVLRDGLLVAMGMLLCWSVWTIHELSIDVAGIKASRFTVQDSVVLKDGIGMALQGQSQSVDNKIENLRTLLEGVANDTAVIKGRLGVVEPDPPKKSR